MLFDLLIVALGLVVIILSMVFVINPPEAWIKRVFHGKADRNSQMAGKND